MAILGALGALDFGSNPNNPTSSRKIPSSVKNAKNRVSIEKNRVIADMCMKDEGFRKAYEDYKRAVNQAYIEKKEGQEVEREPNQ